MKKHHKNIISILLVAIMLLSANCVVLAAEDTLTEVYIEEAARFLSYEDNIYEPESFKYEVVYPAIDKVSENFDSWIVVDTALLEALKEANSMIESKIANGEASIVIDTIAVVRVVVRFGVCYNDRVSDEMLQYIENSEFGISLRNKIESDSSKLYELESAGTCTQADYDELTASSIYYYELIMQHMDGEHDFEEYISNNDATEEADGTKTATCEICGATDTIIDEGSKLKNEDNNCSHLCHQSGIMGVFWKIIQFLWKLFGMNPVCECGAAHY